MSRLLILAALAGTVSSTNMTCSLGTSPSTVTLIMVMPGPSATAVDPSTLISLQFGQPMMAGTEQFVDLHRGGITGPTVPMNCAWSPDMVTLTCAPTPPLATGTHYTIHVGAGVTDADGQVIELSHWTTKGGQWATSGMKDGTHDGQPLDMLGPGWKQGSHCGMLFGFTTG
jgi:Big-like domain-containing protein